MAHSDLHMAVLAAKEPIDTVMFENLDIGNVLAKCSAVILFLAKLSPTNPPNKFVRTKLVVKGSRGTSL